MTANDTRNEALRILGDVLDGGMFIQDAFRISDLPVKGASDLDLRFMISLVRGTTERKTILEAVLRKTSKTPPEKMKPVIRHILFLGMYELFYTGVKPYAAVNEYVSLTKRRGFQGLSGFVNALLRRAAREKDTLLESLSEEEASGLPENVFQAVSAAVGREETLKFGQYVLSEASKKLTVRRNISRCKEEEFLEALSKDGTEVKPLLPAEGFSETEGFVYFGLPEDEIYILDTGSMIRDLQAFRKGFFYVQDSSSWAAFRSLEPFLKPESRVLDLCAAPGGKTFQLMDMARKKDFSARFTACDISEKRIERLRENAERMGFSDLDIRQMDAMESEESFEEAFDLVVSDVPCIGLGDLSGKPEIRFHLTEDAILQLMEIQKKILWNASRYVRPGGILQYSTCSLTRFENQEQIRRFLEKHPDYNLLEEKTLIPGVNTLGDGFYFARMKRNDL